MEKFTPFGKLSKKEQKKQNAAKRVVWSINPITRTTKNPRAYDRNAEKRKQTEVMAG